MMLASIGRAVRTVAGGLASAAVVGVLLAVVSPQRAHAAPPPLLCGDSTAPACAGSCPSGMRCVSLRDSFVSLNGTGPNAATKTSPATEAGVASANGADCECQQVLCGGVALENGQSCCNGTAFTVGVQGCCKGVVVAANATCNCPDPIDLAAQSCCSNGDLDLPPVAAGQSACCNRTALVAAYSLNTHYDCCPESGPDFCFGRCEAGKCVSDDCCECDCEAPADECTTPGSTLPFCQADGSCQSRFSSSAGSLEPDVPCKITCFQFFTPGCDVTAVVQDSACGPDGCVTNTPTGTPTDTPTVTPTSNATQTPTQTPIPQGGSCSADPSNCATGLFCADDVCCDTPCDQPLEACNLPGEVGTCSPVRAPVPAVSNTGLLVITLVLGVIGAVALVRRRAIGRFFGLI